MNEQAKCDGAATGETPAVPGAAVPAEDLAKLMRRLNALETRWELVQAACPAEIMAGIEDMALKVDPAALAETATDLFVRKARAILERISAGVPGTDTDLINSCREALALWAAAVCYGLRWDSDKQPEDTSATSAMASDPMEELTESVLHYYRTAPLSMILAPDGEQCEIMPAEKARILSARAAELEAAQDVDVDLNDVKFTMPTGDVRHVVAVDAKELARLRFGYARYRALEDATVQVQASDGRWQAFASIEEFAAYCDVLAEVRFGTLVAQGKEAVTADGHPAE